MAFANPLTTLAAATLTNSTPLPVDPDQQRGEIKPGRLSTHWHHAQLGHQSHGVIFAPVLNNLAVGNAVNGH
jgi:hypothetical protein